MNVSIRSGIKVTVYEPPMADHEVYLEECNEIENRWIDDIDEYLDVISDYAYEEERTIIAVSTGRNRIITVGYSESFQEQTAEINPIRCYFN